jgi:hypothetical protein
MSTCLAKIGHMAASANQRDNAAGSCSSLETDCGCDEENAKPSLVAAASSALTGSDQDQEFVQEEATILSGWARVKLEPDCQSSAPCCKDRTCHCHCCSCQLARAEAK